LHISQPALSRQIRGLEEEISVLLLERIAKSVSLTQAGRVFLHEARAVLQRADQAIKKAQAVAGADTELHIGYSPTPTARLLPVILRAYQRAMPDVRVRLHTGGTTRTWMDYARVGYILHLCSYPQENLHLGTCASKN
jgi:LysR family transcriptional regulator, benzoate and cis,cis-muconate-responsive activator of ben and cat genes